jgi:hypothetical protein
MDAAEPDGDLTPVGPAHPFAPALFFRGFLADRSSAMRDAAEDAVSLPAGRTDGSLSHSPQRPQPVERHRLPATVQGPGPTRSA